MARPGVVVVLLASVALLLVLVVGGTVVPRVGLYVASILVTEVFVCWLGSFAFSEVPFSSNIS